MISVLSRALFVGLFVIVGSRDFVNSLPTTTEYALKRQHLLRLNPCLQRRQTHQGQYSSNVIHRSNPLPYGRESIRGGGKYYYQDAPLPAHRILRFSQLKFSVIREYFASILVDELWAVLPICLFLGVFQTLILGLVIRGARGIFMGLGLVVIGLALFNFGFLYGLMSTGLQLGLKLPAVLSLTSLLGISSILGITASLAEPALGIVKIVGAQIKESRAPYSFSLLHRHQGYLFLAVSCGVGIASALGILRIRRAWTHKLSALVTTSITLALSAYVHFFSGRRDLIGLAWDLSAVTTGPVTVPLIIALGVGVATVSGDVPSPLTGFGVVTLASLIPVNTILLLGLLLPTYVPPPENVPRTSPVPKPTGYVNFLLQYGLTIAEHFVPSLNSGSPESSNTEPVQPVRPKVPWHMKTPAVEVISGLQAMVPLVLCMHVLRYVVLGDWGLLSTSAATILDRPVRVPVSMALVVALTGVFLFKIGLSCGLAPLGAAVGGALPAAFKPLSGVSHSPLFSRRTGKAIAVSMAAMLGVAATLAEPALAGLATTVEGLTEGQLGSSRMVWSVAIGVGVGVAIGVARVMAGWHLFPLLLVGYSLAIILTLLGDEVIASVAWDSAGVTTGPITAPIVISLGLGLGRGVDLADGFGILSLASVCPIISVLAVSLVLPPSEEALLDSTAPGSIWPWPVSDAVDLTWKAMRPRGRSWREDSVGPGSRTFRSRSGPTFRSRSGPQGAAAVVAAAYPAPASAALSP